MLLAAVFTSACAKEQVAGQGAQSVQNVKVANNKKGDFASTYLSNIDKDAEEYVADFDLHQYLLDSGAISIDRVSTGFDEEISIVARYPNDIIVNYDFEIPSGRQ